MLNGLNTLMRSAEDLCNKFDSYEISIPWGPIHLGGVSYLAGFSNLELTIPYPSCLSKSSIPMQSAR